MSFLVHRWAVGDLKRSLLRGLQTNFKTNESSIPLVHPLHPRFSMNNVSNLEYEPDGQRISRVEERMQVLEMLFKSYYVNDEIFRSLDNATRSSPRSPTAAAEAGTMFPPPASEKDSAIARSNTGGFSHMFNNRNSTDSSDDDDESRQRLKDHQHL